MSENTEPVKRSPHEVDELMAHLDGAMGAAGHKVTNPAAREIIRQQAAGEITADEAKRQLLANRGL